MMLMSNTSKKETSQSACLQDKSSRQAIASTETKTGENKSPGQKTRLEKTQSLLSVISSSVGLIGVAGSVFAFAVSSFYVGSVDIKPDREYPGLSVKVYTKEGHESLFHCKHISLMPGEYHLEISAPEKKALHLDTKISFNKNNEIPVSFDGLDSSKPGQNAELNPESRSKKRWWQFWKRSDSEAGDSRPGDSNAGKSETGISSEAGSQNEAPEN